MDRGAAQPRGDRRPGCEYRCGRRADSGRAGAPAGDAAQRVDRPFHRAGHQLPQLHRYLRLAGADDCSNAAVRRAGGGAGAGRATAAYHRRRRGTPSSPTSKRARTLRRPWWQRAYLDIILLAVAGYGYYILKKQGSILLPGAEAATADPFANPLLFLLPALMVFALTLVMIRILPLFMSLFGWVAGQLGGIGTMLAARQLARTPGFYAGPLLLLTLTLSLSAFTASLATTLDNHLYDQSYYKIGSDMHVVELGEDTELSGGGFGFQIGSGGAGDGETATEEDLGPRWNFIPVSEYLKVDGVKGRRRVWAPIRRPAGSVVARSAASSWAWIGWTSATSPRAPGDATMRRRAWAC